MCVTSNLVLFSELRQRLLGHLDLVSRIAVDGDGTTALSMTRQEVPRLVTALRVLVDEHQPDENGHCRKCRSGPIWRRASSPVAAVPKTAQCRVARYRLAVGAADLVGEFVAGRLGQEPRPTLSPLPVSKQYQQVLAMLCKHPDSWFTVNELTSKLIRVRKCARRPTAELYAAGYLLRRMSDGGKPGRAEYQYRLDPDAAPQARALLDA